MLADDCVGLQRYTEATGVPVTTTPLPAARPFRSHSFGQCVSLAPLGFSRRRCLILIERQRSKNN